MTDTFNAWVIDRQDAGSQLSEQRQLTLADLPEQPVLVDIDYSSLNYKDGLVVTGKGKVVRQFPMVAGIDLAGTVAQSDDSRFAAGDKVVVNGHGLSEMHWGGYSQRQRLSGDWLTRLPDAFTTEQAMALGTAGYTAMLSVMAICDHGVSADAGPVLVTGAAGGVGSVAIALLAKLGYSVTASTGRLDATEAWLRGLGASEVIDRSEFEGESKPLAKERWAAVVDSVGGQPLANILAQTQYEGIVTACGLAAGMGLPATVAPFILRGVTLRGIDSVMAGSQRRERAWQLLAELVDPAVLASAYQVEPMSRLHELGAQILRGEVKGRVVIDVNA